MGLDVPALARAANHIHEARDALSHYAAHAAREAVALDGSLTLPRRAYGDAPSEIRRRLIVAACRWITGADYPARRNTVLHALSDVDLPQPGQHVAALGLGQVARVKWRLAGLARDEAAASPAVWEGDRLVAAPVIRPMAPYDLRPVRDASDFRRLVMAH